MEAEIGLALRSLMTVDNTLPQLTYELPAEQQVHEGLKGVVVARTKISAIDGDRIAGS